MYENGKRKNSHVQRVLSLTALKAPLAVLTVRRNCAVNIGETVLQRSLHLYAWKTIMSAHVPTIPYLRRRFYIPIAHVVFVSFVPPFSHPLLVLLFPVFSLFALSSERSTMLLWSAYINDWAKGRCGEREKGASSVTMAAI